MGTGSLVPDNVWDVSQRWSQSLQHNLQTPMIFFNPFIFNILISSNIACKLTVIREKSPFFRGKNCWYFWNCFMTSHIANWLFTQLPTILQQKKGIDNKWWPKNTKVNCSRWQQKIARHHYQQGKLVDWIALPWTWCQKVAQPKCTKKHSGLQTLVTSAPLPNAHCQLQQLPAPLLLQTL